MLVIAQESADTRYLHKALSEAAHSLECVSDTRDAQFIASSERFDAVILHMSAAGSMDGLIGAAHGLARHVQGATFVVIADLPDSSARAALLWVGVDACFARQFSFMELHERIQRLCALREKRRDEMAEARLPEASAVVSPTPASDAPRLDTHARAIVRGAHRMALTRQEFLLLECLMRGRDTAIGRADITRYAWPDKDDINPASVNLVISRLRKKLEAGGFELGIETVAGVGYRLAYPSAMRSPASLQTHASAADSASANTAARAGSSAHTRLNKPSF
jgi:DNA-binding response OmpR family regulator